MHQVLSRRAGRARPTRLVAVAGSFALLTAVLPLLATLASSPAAEAAGPLALPDLVSVIPTNQMEITHPTTTTKEFQYEHIVFNNGTGPLDVMPTYNPATGTATGTQRIYSYDANNNPVLSQQTPVHDQFIWHEVHGHFHFPLASFGLYSAKADGSIGGAVAVSPKNGFCIGDSVQVDPTVLHSPPDIVYTGATCIDPTADRGIDPGWGDLYDRRDPGQSIDITGVPDGVYWFHAVADPDNNFQEADKTNNTTDIKLRISGDTITPLNPLMSQGSFIIDQSFVKDGVGSTSTPSFSTSAPNELLVAMTSAQGNSTPQTETVTGGGLNWTLAKRTNTRAGTSEVWTAMAPNPLTNAVVTAQASTTGFSQSMTLMAVRGAAGIGAVAGNSGATGAPNVGLTTTGTGSWVLGVGNDPDHYAPRMPSAGQVIMQQTVNEATSTDTWAQATNGPTANAGTAVTLSDSSPIGSRWNYTAVELLAANSNDHTPPVISQGTAGTIGPDRATVSWTTNEPATSRIAYGPTTAFGSTTPLDPTLVTAHAQTITGLQPNTTYFCELQSADSAGNQGTSTAVSFTTTPPRTTPAVFSNVHLSDLQPDQATFAWTTDEPASSQVEYGLTTAYGTSSPVDSNQVTTHFQVVTGLTPATTYHYRVKGTDPYGNAGASSDFTLTTPALPPPITVDTTVSTDGRGPVTTASFNTVRPNELLVAYVSTDGPVAVGQGATVSGGGLTWSLVSRANTQAGDAEVWTAIAPASPINMTVSSTINVGTFDQQLTVVAYGGASGIGASKVGSGNGSAPSVTFNMTRSGSLVYAVANDWNSATNRTLGSGQTMVHQFVDTTAGDTFWTQRLSAVAGPVESIVTMSSPAPSNAIWNMVAVEIVRPQSVPAVAPTITGVTASNITGSSATVSWQTDQPSSSQIKYGTTTAYGSTTALDNTAVRSHSQTITGLTPGTTYHFSVRSGNSIGTTGSADATFTTSTTTTPANQTITFAALADRALNQSPFAVSATATSGLAVTFTTTTPAVCTAGGTNGATITLIATGPCTVVANQAGNASFNPAPAVTRSFTVTPASTPGAITVDRTVFKDGNGAQTTPAFTTASSGDLLVAFVASDGPVGSTQTATVTGAGLTWSLVKRTNVQAGTSEIWQARATGVLTNATVTATPAKTGFDQSLTVVAFAGAAGVGASASGNALTGVPAVGITTTAPGSLIYGVGNDWDGAIARTPLPGQAIVHQFVDTAVGDTFWSQGSSTAVANAGTGYFLGDSAPNNHRWNFTGVEITAGSSTPPPPVNQTITFGALANRALNQSPLTVSATATSGLAVSFTTTTPAVCTAGGTNGATITLVGLGPCSVVANQSGNASFNPAPAVTQSFTVTPANQTITFAALADRALDQSPFTVSATATSGLAVTFTTTTPAVCTAGGTNGATIALVTTGLCTVVANQAGNASFNPAPAVTRSFTVTPVGTPGGITVDRTVFKDGNGAQTTPAFTTASSGDLLVAFVASDGPLGSTQTATVTGAGLTWSLVKRTNTQAGTSEIWQARATGVLTNATVTATPAKTGFDQSLTVVAFAGATGIGASVSASATTGAPVVNLATTAPGSLVYGVGNDWDGAAARTPNAGQAIVHQFVDTAVGDTFWSQATTAAVANAGTTIALGDTAPTNHRWNLAALEIKSA